MSLVLVAFCELRALEKQQITRGNMLSVKHVVIVRLLCV